MRNKDSDRKHPGSEAQDFTQAMEDPIMVLERNDLPDINKRIQNMSLDMSKLRECEKGASHTDGTDRTDREILEENFTSRDHDSIYTKMLESSRILNDMQEASIIAPTRIMSDMELSQEYLITTDRRKRNLINKVVAKNYNEHRRTR